MIRKPDGGEALCEIAVALPVHGTFTYRLPEAPAPVGSRVLVPFGRRRTTGYVLSHGGAEREDVRTVIDLLDDTPLFPATMVPFFLWVSAYYLHPPGEVIRAALPGGLTVGDVVVWSLSPAGRRVRDAGTASAADRRVLDRLTDGSARRREIERALGGRLPGGIFHRLARRGWIRSHQEVRRGKTRRRMEKFVRAATGPAPPVRKLSAPKLAILDRLASAGEISLAELRGDIPTASRHLRALEGGGFVSVRQRPVYRDPFGEAVRPDRPRRLTPDQARVVGAVGRRLGRGFATFVLAGVTGSGKTEVYLHLAARAVRRGKNVLILVPEIALIAAMERRFRARFGERVAVLHSRLSAGERYDQWLRIRQGQAPIAVGARSAVFAPFERLGLIVVDEEHDGSYKQEGGLRYNARDLAVVRGREAEAAVLLGSATPSLETWHNVETGRFRALRLNQRIENRPLPRIEVEDLRAGRDQRGLNRFFTPRLRSAMEATLARQQQVLLFINRRGYATYPVCAACGEALTCRHCDVTLTLHRRDSAYRCHYCGWSLPAATACPQCAARRIKPLGLGTERVEAAARALFPAARVERMDRDTTVRKGAVVEILNRLRRRETDILVGTQMVAKGHDFAHITLVGVICADLSLNFPDFRAAERTFQLLAQVAGRAGRGQSPGRVVLQTYAPQHFSIAAARDQDFEAFYRQEAVFRDSLGYPPFARMVQLRISGRDAGRVRDRAAQLGRVCGRLLAAGAAGRGAVEILGPVDSPLSRVADRHRRQMLLKGPAGPLRNLVRRLMADGHTATGSGVRVSVDVDPYSML